MAVRPTTDDERADLTERFRSPEILTLARKGVSLDIFSLAAREGGLQVQQRLRSALLTFDAAVKQDHNAVACILYIAAAESLTTPNAPWRMERLTKRFVEFFDDLMPDAVDEIVAHGNFEEAIGVRRGTRTPRALRRETLTRLYSMRSGPLHEDLGPSYPGFIVDSGRDIRRALFNDFAEAAILRFKDSPRSSLVGNPALEPNAGEADTHTEIFGLVRPLQKAWRSVCALLRVRAASIKQGKRAR